MAHMEQLNTSKITALIDAGSEFLMCLPDYSCIGLFVNKRNMLLLLVSLCLLQRRLEAADGRHKDYRRTTTTNEKHYRYATFLTTDDLIDRPACESIPLAV